MKRRVFVPVFSLIVWTLAYNSQLSQDAPDRSFSIYYDVFTYTGPAPIRWEDLPKRGHDVTSCFAPVKERLISILQKADRPARFEERLPKLYIKVNGDLWLVDDAGVVRHNSTDLALTKKEFGELLVLVTTRLPVNDLGILRRARNRIEP